MEKNQTNATNEKELIGQEGTAGRTLLKPKLRIKITNTKGWGKVYVIRYLEVVGGGGLKGVWVKG